MNNFGLIYPAGYPNGIKIEDYEYEKNHIKETSAGPEAELIEAKPAKKTTKKTKAE